MEHGFILRDGLPTTARRRGGGSILLPPSRQPDTGPASLTHSTPCAGAKAMLRKDQGRAG